jgi:hypothetical protein
VSDGGTPRHLPVFFCPYCGEEDIRPFGEAPGQWRCADCRRVWTVRFVGLTGVEPVQPTGPAGTASTAATVGPADTAGVGG